MAQCLLNTGHDGKDASLMTGSEQVQTRGASRGPLLLLSMLALALALAAAVGLWWWQYSGFAPAAPRADGAPSAALEQRSAALARSVAAIDAVSALLAVDLPRKAETELATRLQRAGDDFVQRTGLLAVSWWPRDENRPAAYLRRIDGDWAAAPEAAAAGAAARMQAWYLMAPRLARAGCLWSAVESESFSQRAVVSCSRAATHAGGEWSGVLRMSFAVDALFAPVRSGGDALYLLADAQGRVLASSDAALERARNLGDVGQQRPQLGPLSTAVYLERESQRQAASRTPPEGLAQALVQAGAAGSLERASELIRASSLPGSALAGPAQCRGGLCTEPMAVANAPWRIERISEAGETSLLSLASGYLPLLVIVGGLLLLALLSYFVARALLLRPLLSLSEPLSRQNPGPAFNERLHGEFGRIAKHLNELIEGNQKLRAQLLDPRRAAAAAAAASAPPPSEPRALPLEALPLPALIIDAQGVVIDSNPPARSLLSLKPGDATGELDLRTAQGKQWTLGALPGGWHAVHCTLRHPGLGERRVMISTNAAGDPRGTLVMLQPAAVPPSQRGAAPASADADARLSRSASLRLALSTLTQPVHWLLLQAGPETPLPQLADAQTRESFNEQLRARVEDRLESSENLLLLGADRFLVSAPSGISQDRADALRQGLQTALVFYEGQRMRLKASTHLLTVRPGMRVEDVDAAIHQQLHRDSDSGLPGGTAAPARSFSVEEWNRLIATGFDAQRFHLITERGRPPGKPGSESLVFRVLPHLEDDEGFWLGLAEFLPAVERLGRRADLDSLVVEEVRRALASLRGEVPEQVFLPLSAQGLMGSHDEVAEKLGTLAHDPAMSGLRLVLCFSAQELREGTLDLGRLHSLTRSLGCRVGLESLSVDASSLLLMEKLQPDVVIPRPELTAAALESPSFAIGLESLIRAAERLKATPVLTGINDNRAQQLAEKLGAGIAFGGAIGKPSPLLFQAVA